MFVIAGLLRVDGAAYRGVRTPRARPMRMRAAARGDQSERRAEGGGGESRGEKRRERRGEEAHQGFMSFNLRGRP